MSSISLRSRRVLCDGQLKAAVVHVEGGRIARILPDGPAAVDLGEAALVPGLVDSHVHINEPGRTEWEGFASATRAAALGGVTTLVDMPLNSSPVTTSLGALEAKVAATQGKLTVDVAFWGGVVPGNAPELAPMARAGVRGFKCFLCPSGLDEFAHVTDADLRVAMPILREHGLPMLFHAELEDELDQVPLDADPRAYSRYLHARPKRWEERAVALVIQLVRETGCRAHIVHLSAATALPLLRAAKAEGLPITAETCPHYLGLTAEEVPDGATEFKCAPPIRERSNQDALWEALRDGTLDVVVTDHSPCIPGLKNLGTGDFLTAWGGIASLQLGFGAVWKEAARRGFDLPTVLRWMAAAPGALAGLGRGHLRVGARADLAVVDVDATFRVDAASLAHRHPQTPWIGRHLRGRVTHTWLAGEPVVHERALVGALRGRALLSGEHGG